MDKIEKAVAGVCSPLFNEWRLKASLTEDEAAAFWFKEFESKTTLQTSQLLYCSTAKVDRDYYKARHKILKIL